MKAAVMTGKVKKCIAVIAFLKGGSISPGGIWVSIMPGPALFHRETFLNSLSGDVRLDLHVDVWQCRPRKR